MASKTFTLTATVGFLFALIAPAHALTLVQGAVDAREAKILVQTAPNQQVSIKENGKILYQAKADDFGLVKFTLKDLQPNTKYNFAACDEKSSEEFSVRTIADYLNRTPPPDVKIAIVGKVHRNDALYDQPYKTEGNEYEIFDAIQKQNCDAVIWANNAAKMRPADYGSFSGIMNRYIYEKSAPEMANLLKSTANYAIMSENSFGAPNADKWIWNKADIVEAFERNWANPTIIPTNEKCMATFFRISDVEFFLLDSMSNRNNFDYNECLPEMLGKEQKYWLFNALKSSTAKFKVVVSNAPILTPAESKGNFSVYDRERREFLNFILKNTIQGLVFVSSNKNYSEITKFIRPSAYELYELTVGATSDRPAEKASEMNFFRIPGSTTFKRAFATITVSGKEDERVLTLTIYDSKSEKCFSHEIKESALTHFE